LRSELDRIEERGNRVDNLVLITNVSLSASYGSGTIDRLHAIAQERPWLKHFAAWGGEELSTFLVAAADVRQAFTHLLTSGDVLADLLNRRSTALAQTIALYLTTKFERDRLAILEQAGDAGDDKVPLERIFIDLRVQLGAEHSASLSAQPDIPNDRDLAKSVSRREPQSALQMFLQTPMRKVVLIGGPGEGKSTLGQFLCQIHRAALLGGQVEFSSEGTVPVVGEPRLPFRIVLRELGQWLADAAPDSQTVEAFLASDVTRASGRRCTSEDVQEIFRTNQTVLVLDGLDEVPESTLREATVNGITEFLGRVETALGSDVQVLATSRPQGYSHEFDPKAHLHFELMRLTPAQVDEYVNRWLSAKALPEERERRLREVVHDVAQDPQIQALLQTPLQVTIMLIVILAGGTPPSERESLFHEYVDTIYRRETAKFKENIRTDRQLLIGLHQYVAMILHAEAVAESVRSSMSDEVFRTRAREYLGYQDPVSPPEAIDRQVDDLVREATDRLVLLVGLEDRRIGFELRSLQEYFAASFMVDTATGSEDRQARFRAIATTPHWRNVALFFGGRLARTNPGEASNLIDVCREIDRDAIDVVLRRGSYLALELAADRVFGPARRHQLALVEIGLSLLEGSIDSWVGHEVLSFLQKLPTRDLADLVMPLLKAKSESLSLVLLPRVIHLAGELDPTHEAVRHGIERLIVEGDEAARAKAVTLYLELVGSDDWLESHAAAPIDPNLFDPLRLADLAIANLAGLQRFTDLELLTGENRGRFIADLIGETRDLEFGEPLDPESSPASGSVASAVWLVKVLNHTGGRPRDPRGISISALRPSSWLSIHPDEAGPPNDHLLAIGDALAQLASDNGASDLTSAVGLSIQALRAEAAVKRSELVDRLVDSPSLRAQIEPLLARLAPYESPGLAVLSRLARTASKASLVEMLNRFSGPGSVGRWNAALGAIGEEVEGVKPKELRLLCLGFGPLTSGLGDAWTRLAGLIESELGIDAANFVASRDVDTIPALITDEMALIMVEEAVRYASRGGILAGDLAYRLLGNVGPIVNNATLLELASHLPEDRQSLPALMATACRLLESDEPFQAAPLMQRISILADSDETDLVLSVCSPTSMDKVAARACAMIAVESDPVKARGTMLVLGQLALMFGIRIFGSDIATPTAMTSLPYSTLSFQDDDPHLAMAHGMILAARGRWDVEAIKVLAAHLTSSEHEPSPGHCMVMFGFVDPPHDTVIAAGWLEILLELLRTSELASTDRESLVNKLGEIAETLQPKVGVTLSDGRVALEVS
jgi:hypothetical protein